MQNGVALVKTFLKKRTPTFHEIYLVYSIVNYLAYTWAIIAFFYYLSSWVLFMPLADLFYVLCYGLLPVIVDVVLITIVIIVIESCLPTRIIKDRFVPVGGLFAIVFFFWITYLQMGFDAIFSLLPMQQYVLATAVIASTFSTIYIAYRFKRIAKFIEAIAKRLTIFVFIYGFLGLISLIVVLARNLL